MNTLEKVSGRRRRRHSADFKAQVIAAARQPGVSSAAVALAHSINANMLRRWVLEAECAEGGAPKASAAQPAPSALSTRQSFVAVPLLTRAADSPPIQIEVRRGATSVNVQWPSSSMPECALWLRELLR